MQPMPYTWYYTYERLTGRNVGKSIGPAKSATYGAAPDDDNDAITPRATTEPANEPAPAS